MNKHLSDEQLDQMMRTLLNDAALDDSAINDIATSPTMWWAVQRQIAQQKETAVSPWPPVNALRRWLMIGVPALAALAIVIGIFVSRPPGGSQDVAGLQQNVSEEPVSKPTLFDPEPAVPTKVLSADTVIPVVEKQRVSTLKPVVRTASTVKRSEKVVIEQTAKTTENKSEFIALSYASDPESGQLVRVKVPSSMMVTLGLVASVEKPSNLVDAEVIIGDDGLTRSIRFIR